MVLRLHQHNIGYTADGFYRSDEWWPNQQCQSTEGGWLVIHTGLSLTMLTSPCYNTGTATTVPPIIYKVGLHPTKGGDNEHYVIYRHTCCQDLDVLD